MRILWQGPEPRRTTHHFSHLEARIDLSLSAVRPLRSLWTRRLCRARIEFRTWVVTDAPEGAEIWVDGQLVTRRGAEWRWTSPALTTGQRRSYAVRARWNENGRVVNQTRTINVQGTGTTTVDFTRPESGNTPNAPNRPKTDGGTNPQPNQQPNQRPGGLDEVRTPQPPASQQPQVPRERRVDE